MAESADVVEVVQRGSFATLATYRHDPAAPHRDPDEEAFDATTVMLTEGGTWTLETAIGRTDVDPSVVVVGTEGRAFRASHGDERPTDLTTFVEFRASDSSFGQELAPLVERLRSIQAVPRTREIARVAGALERATAAVHPALRLDVLTIELLLAIGDADLRTARPSSVRADILDRVLLARDYLDAHAHEDVRLADLARHAALSPFYLARVFRQVVGTSPHAYLLQRRLDLAAAMLRRGDRSVTQVAFDVGFSSPSHFAKRFRERFGVPPNRFRRLPD